MPSTQVYATVAELRAHIDRLSATDDTVLLQILTAASRSIDNACNRKLDGFVTEAVATARLFAGSGGPTQRIDECTSVTGVGVKDSSSDTTFTAWASGTWVLFRGDPRWPEFNVPPFDNLMATGGGGFYGGFGCGPCSDSFYPLRSRAVRSYAGPVVQVTGRWGYADTCPPEIREATIMQAARWYKRMQGAMSDTLADGELGMLLYHQALDPDIRRILIDGRYVRATVGRK